MPKKSKAKFQEYDLLRNQAGFMELEDEEEATQQTIKDSVDITNAAKGFELTLDKFGPYKIDYSRAGRSLLLGGSKGHLAAFDWQTKKLLCEINVMETVRAVKWLHRETMFAVAQKQWTYLYDNNGIELHCLKMLDSVLQLEFLPYHFLLATSSSKSYLSWLDVSMGKMVGGMSTGLGRLDVMTHNPQNAICLLGHSSGTVTMWSPNVKEPLCKMLCHSSDVISIAVHKNGNHIVTSGSDRKLKVWDIRTYQMLSSYSFSQAPQHLHLSQRGLLAAGFHDRISVYEDPTQRIEVKKPYLSHPIKMPGIGGVRFCPYEDVLGVGHSIGFSSLLVPGAGEADFDAYEANPFESKKQQKEAEVKMLLNKIQPDLITMETRALGHVNVKSLKEKMEDHIRVKFPKAPSLKVELKRKKKGKGTGRHLERRKELIKGTKERQYREKMIKLDDRERKAETTNKKSSNEDDSKGKIKRKNKNDEIDDNNVEPKSTFNPLDRFKRKKW